MAPEQVTLTIFYAVFKASWSKFDMSRCTLSPSCSRFALDAVSAHGAPGLLLTFARLMRDHHADYHRAHPTQRGLSLDGVRNYTFFWGAARADGHGAHEEPAHAWDEHVRAHAR